MACMDLIYWAAMEANCHLTHEDLKLEDVWTSFLLTGYLRFNGMIAIHLRHFPLSSLHIRSV